jgi:hypothetical protein
VLRSDAKFRISGGFDAHINLLKSRRAIPHSSRKPDLRF